MKRTVDGEQKISIIMPCKNEENTVGICVDEAMRMLAEHGLDGEVIVVDNGSTDASAKRASEHGARVVSEERPGYGSAIRKGLSEAAGDLIVIGDCDTTYDFMEAYEICAMLSDGYDMVIPDRFAGGIEKGAMPFSHRVGVKVLSFLGRCRFHTDVRDFHCGLRGLTREAADKIKLHTDGMEFATEMIAEGARCGLQIGQMPVTLGTCKGLRSSKLRTLRDGFRHLAYIFKTTSRQRR